jgi:hypothetical protein
MAENGPSKSPDFSDLNVRYWEKRTFPEPSELFTKLTSLERPLSAPKRTLD